MSDLELRVRVEAEVAAARREISGLKAEVAAFGQAAKAASGVRMQDMVNQFAGVKAATNSARDSAFALLGGLDQVATGYDMLRASIDPAYAATQRFTEAQTMARIAVANGIATEQQAAQTLDLLAQKLGLVEGKSELTGRALSRVHMSSGMAAGSVGNLAAQFNDVAMMAALGQNPLMIAIQQGTQIGQVLGQAGAGGAVGMLKAGFMAFLSPTTLVTIALIAGGAALVQWAIDAFGSVDAAAAATKANDAYSTSFNTLQGDISAAKSLHGEYVEAMKAGNRELMHLIELEAEARQAQFAVDRIGLDDSRKTASEALAAAKADYDAKKILRDEFFAHQVAAQKAHDDAMAGEGDPGQTAARLEATNVALAVHAENLATVRATLDKTSADYAVIDAQINVMNARIAATGDLIGIVKNGVDKATGSAEELWEWLVNAADAAGVLSGAAPQAGWLTGAIADAGTLAATLWDAAAAWTDALSKAPSTGGGGRPDVPGLNSDDVSMEIIAARLAIRNMIAAGGSSGGGGGSASGGLSALSAQAQKTLADLDLAIAAINEKVKAGLMTTAEAADGVTSAKERAANALADLIVQLDKFGPSGSAAADLLRANMRGLAVDLKAIGSDLADTLAEGFKSPFKDFLTGASTAREAMGDFGEFVMDKLAEMAAAAAVNDFFKPLMNMLSSGLADAFGLMGGGDFKVSAAGGVPGGAPLSAYRDQVLDQPTLFPMARGMGLMAEAGPEAIMPVGGGVLAMMGGREIRLPLTRGAGGRLGVELPQWDAGILDRAPVRFAQGAVFGSSPSWATGAGRDGGGRMGNVIVNVTTPPGHTAQVQERSNGGDLNLDVIVELIENRLAGNARAGRGAHVAALSDTFSLDRRPR